MIKPVVKRFLRNLGIIKMSDNLRYNYMKLKNYKSNSSFIKENPDISIPPDYLLYEAHQINYKRYYENGFSNANLLKEKFEKYLDLEGKKVLDWGCGPGRIIRHFPELLPKSEFYGTDYNVKSITWNKEHIKNVSFLHNEVSPPTVFDSDFFDVIYGLSIFTHLSKKNHELWIDELHRIANKGAVLLLTTHGQAYREKLLDQDKKTFDRNELVVEDKTMEGHRTFAAYQPPKLMRSMFKRKFQILEHIPGKKMSWGISQDQWILRKN